jgi:ATP-dependent exoDNAse (exonuclease V) alpha subunit
MYKVDDMILVGTNEVKDEYTEMFCNIEKYYCKENNRLYSNGDIVIGSKPECKSEIRHAYTTHSIQGETAQYNLFIDADKMFDARMFYTAISRAKVLEQIFIVE